MPELPEVETVRRGLEPAMTGVKITRITLKRAGLRFPFPPALKVLKNVSVTHLTRRAKYLLIHLADNRTMVVHLGMSGRMTINAQGTEKHDHMIIHLHGGGTVVFNDPRRFGFVDLIKTAELATHKFFRHLAPEPLDDGFTAGYLAEKLKNKKTAIKIAIMDQRLVVGVGNIYASEALYVAKIDPSRVAASLQPAEIKKLAAAIRRVLAKAIKAGGSSLRDYKQADGSLGYFQHQWSVYDKAGGHCPACRKPCILKITQGQRSTFYCPVRQK